MRKGRLDAFINTHKYAITVTAIAVVSLMVLRHQAKNNLLTVNKQAGSLVMLPPQWSNSPSLKNDDSYAFVRAG